MKIFEQALSDLDLSPAGGELEKRIRNRSARVGVIGLGNVGLPLALEMAQAGFQVTGIDLDRIRVDSANSGMSYILDVPNESLFSLVRKGTFRATQSFAAIENLDTLIICVPTPLKKTKDPKLSYVVAAIEAVNNHLKIGHLIIVESTIYPGTAREVVLPILQKSGLQVGKHFFLAFSPQRVEPVSGTYTGRITPKIIGGMTDRCSELSTLFYRQFIEKIVPVSCSEAARSFKLLEN